MTTFSSKGLQNDNLRITKSEIRFGPLRIYRVSSVPNDDEGRIGDIVIVDDTKGNDITLPIDRVPADVGMYQKVVGGVNGTWVTVGASPGVFVRTIGDTMTGDLIMDGARIGIDEAAPSVSLDIGSTDAIKLPSGTTAERPVGAGGMVRYNSDTDLLEGFVTGMWDDIVFSSDNRFRLSNTAIVSKTPGPNQFASINDAIASITTATDTNRFTVLVAPGTYTETPIAMKPFVNVISVGGAECSVIEPSSPNQDIIAGVANSTIHGFEIRGATGSGFAGIRILDTTGSRFSVTDCSITNCAKLLVIDSSSAGAQVDLDRTTLNITDNTERAIEVIGGAGGIALYLGTDVGVLVQGDAALINAALVTGSTAVYITDSFNYSGRSAFAGGPTPVDGFVVEDGCTVTLGNGFVTDFDINLRIADVGAGPNIDILTGNFQGGATRDISIEHPDTTGSMLTKTQRTKTFIDPTSSVSVFYLDPVDEGIVSVGSFFLGTNHSKITDVNDLINAEPMMGVMDGGELSDGVGAFDVDVAAGFGFLMVTPFPDHETRRIEWAAATLTIPANDTQWIFVNNAGIITTAGARPNERHNIILGRVTTGSAGILFLEELPVISHHGANLFDNTLREALGPVYVSGSSVAENGVTDRALDVSSGIYYVSQNRIAPSGATPITFIEFFHSAGVFDQNTGVTQVNNTQYDNGTDLVALSSGFFAKHSLYVVGDGTDEKYLLVFSQAEYSDLVTAEAADIPTPPNSFNTGSVVLVANIITEEGNTNIALIEDARPVLGFKATGVSATANHGNLFGLAADDHPQYLLIDGTRSMGGDLNMGSNNITNTGLIDGVDVSTHQARHLPNGLDPITTAAPTSNLTATTANSIGIQNSLARSDHNHAITTGAPNTTLAPDDTNATGVAATLSRSDHIHQFTIGAAVTLNAASTNTTGTANSFARSDHTHQIDGFQEVIEFEDDGVSAGGTFTIINFTGNISAVDAGAGELEVNVPTVQTPQVITAIIGSVTGTTQIPFDNSVPLVTEGTQIVSASITPQSATNQVEVSLSFSWEHTDVPRGLAIPVFRGSTLVGMAVDSYGDGGNPDDNLRNVSYTFVDSPATTVNTTYSVRVGANGVGTWRVNNRGNGNNFGGALINANTFVLKEILV